ncbi:MAG: BtpA/SgcQ family protein [Acidimicrobiia bacterium]
MTLPSLIGMVHLGPLPGSPRFDDNLDRVIARATSDAIMLKGAGFDALLIENFGDAPFFAGTVPPVTVAAVTRAAHSVIDATGCSLGINVLRNDGIAALAIASATGAAFIRVNVLSGLMFTDQGPITGQAAKIARRRREWCPDVMIMADVMVKHSSPPPRLTLEQAGVDTSERGGADALIVSGPGTGVAPDPNEGRRLRKALPEALIYVGSGATVANVAELATFANGVIVGSALKVESLAQNPVDPSSARAFRQAAAGVGW